MRTAIPNSVMNPTNVATLRLPAVTTIAKTPPINASGRFTMTSSVLRMVPNSWKRSRKIATIESTDSTAIVCAALRPLSNWPPKSTWYPGGTVTPAAIACRKSSTTLPTSRFSTFACTTSFRRTPSRLMTFGPRSSRTLATIASGILVPSAPSSSAARTRSAEPRNSSSKRTTRSNTFCSSSTSDTTSP